MSIAEFFKKHPYKIIFSICLGLYLVFTLPLLTKDLNIFPDEVSFTNTAHSIADPDDFGKNHFEKRLVRIRDATDSTFYGPVYFASLAAVVKIFGPNIYTVRLFSVLLGAVCLFLLINIIRVTTKNPLAALAAGILLAVNIDFLRMSRMGRMEIMVLMMSLLAYRIYFSSYESRLNRRDFFVGILMTLGLFTHFVNGAAACIVIILHLLLFSGNKQRVQKAAAMTILPISFFVMWLIYINLINNELSTQGFTVLANSKLSELHGLPIHMLTKMRDLITRADTALLTHLTYLSYFVIFFIVIFLPKKNAPTKLWLINFIFVFALATWGNSFFYLALIAPAALILMAYLPKTIAGRLITAVILLLLLPLGFVQQISLLNFYADFSYKDFSRQISECITEDNAKVLLGSLSPDPYFYLVSNRKNLKFVYQRFHDPDSKDFYSALTKADYLVGTYAYEAASSMRDYEAVQKDKNLKAIYIENVGRLGIKTEIVDYIRKHKKSVCAVNQSDKYDAVAVFKL